MDTGCICVSTTWDDESKLRALAKRLVDERLAACVQLVPVHSIYRWQGAVESAAEYRLVLKTREALQEAVIEAIASTHGYDVPEIIVTPIIGGGDAYLAWICEATQPAG